MDTFFSQNLQYLRKSLEGKVSQEKMADELDIKKSTLSSYESGRAEPRYSDLLRLATYFKVSVDDLLTKDLGKTQPITPLPKDRLRVLATTVNADNEDNIELVSVKAVAGYTQGFADLDYVSQLPTFQVPFLSKQKKYRVFTVQGDSMLPLQNGSLVFAEYIDNWENVKDGTICVVVTKEEGVVLKEIHNYLATKNVLILRSTNDLYAPYPILGEEILELWRFVGYYSNAFPA
jgi:phage repressor protein C with HTH and peptisase S24 domain